MSNSSSSFSSEDSSSHCDLPKGSTSLLSVVLALPYFNSALVLRNLEKWNKNCLFSFVFPHEEIDYTNRRALKTMIAMTDKLENASKTK